MLEKLFHLAENQTTVRREAIGGCTTFLTMSYIIFFQPAILSNTGMDFGAVMTATCLSSALATFLMAFLANYPIALAPAVGLNVFFTFEVCGAMGVPWETALGAVFVSGVIFVLLGTFGFRKKVMDIIPPAVKFSIAAGIGLFITLLGFEWAGIVVDDKVTLVTVGDLNNQFVLVSGVGLAVSMLFTCWGIRGAIFLGIITSACTALAVGLVSYHGVFSAPPSLSPTFLAMKPLAALKVDLFAVIFVFFLIDLFDTIGTLSGVAQLGGFLKDGELPRARRALLADAIGTAGGAMLGTSHVTSYVESCSGISDGARTGLASLVTGCLFLLALFFSPLVEMLGQGIAGPSGAILYPIIAPALVMVGFMMMRAVQWIPWDNPAESIPAFLTIILIGFSFSITDGISFGFISYTFLKLMSGKIRSVHPVMIGLSIVFLLRFIFI